MASPNGLGHPRLGLAISQAAAGGAVQRNTIKRVVREEFRQRLAELPPVDLVVSAGSNTGEASNAELRASLRGLWREVARRCESF